MICVRSVFICVYSPQAQNLPSTPEFNPYSNRDLGHVYHVPLYYDAYCCTSTCSLHPLTSFSPFPSCFFKQNRLDFLSAILPLCRFLFVSVFFSAPPFILLSFNYPPGSRVRSLQKAKAGTSLPVYIKYLSFKATGTAVKQ